MKISPEKIDKVIHEIVHIVADLRVTEKRIKQRLEKAERMLVNLRQDLLAALEEEDKQ